MTTTLDSALARRYLLGIASDLESAVIEQDYLEQEAALERIAAAEDDLIEDYLANALTAVERTHFEQTYLSVPLHQMRVETVRRLMAHGAASPVKVSSPRLYAIGRNAWLAMAASLIVGVATFWLLFPPGTRRADVAETREPSATPVVPDQPPAPPVATPRVFAITLAAVSVRGMAESATVVIPPATDVVAIGLEAESDARRLAATRATIRTVGGEPVWNGAVTVEGGPGRVTVARLDVPAPALPAEDYIVTLFGTDDARVEREWTQFFLRVRAR